MRLTSKIFANFRLLAAGRVLTALLNLTAIGLLSRALDLAEFGTVVLIHVYVLTVRGLVSLKPALAIVRWGVPLLDANDQKGLVELLALSSRLDWGSAILSVLVGVLFAPAVAGFMDWSDASTNYAMVFSIVLIMSGTGTASGYLRLTERWNLVALLALVGPLIRVIAATFGIANNATIEFFLFAWGLSLLAEHAVLKLLGALVCRYDGLAYNLRRAARLSDHQGYAPFVYSTYLQSVLDLVPHRIAVLMVGSSLGPESGGLFRAAKEVSSVLARPAEILREVVFPDLTRLWDRDRSQFLAIVIKVCGIAGLIGIIFASLSLWFGDWLLTLLFGPAFGPAATLLSLLLGAAGVELAGSALRPAGNAMGRPVALLVTQAIGALVLVVSYYPLQSSFGLSGAGLAVSLGVIVHSFGMAWVVAGGSMRS